VYICSAIGFSNGQELLRVLKTDAGSHYDILGVPQDCSKEDIKVAHRKLCKLLHPDKCSEANAPAAFRQVQKSYEVLSNDVRKAAYDNIIKAKPKKKGKGKGKGKGSLNKAEDAKTGDDTKKDPEAPPMDGAKKNGGSKGKGGKHEKSTAPGGQMPGEKKATSDDAGADPNGGKDITIGQYTDHTPEPPAAWLSPLHSTELVIPTFP